MYLEKVKKEIKAAEAIPGYMGAGGFQGSRSGLYGNELTPALRQEFKKFGIKATVKKGRGCSAIAVTVQAAEDEIINKDLILDYRPDFSINNRYIERYEDELTPELIDKLLAVQYILDSYNYDESNSQVDYFNRGFYDSIYIKVC